MSSHARRRSLALFVAVGLMALTPVPAFAADADAADTVDGEADAGAGLADAGDDTSRDATSTNGRDAAHDLATDVSLPPNFPEDGCAVGGTATRSSANGFVSLLLLAGLVLVRRRRRDAGGENSSDRGGNHPL